MPAIEKISRPVFLAPTLGRCFLTARSAAYGEARAMLLRKYPTERSVDDEFGRQEDSGWHWTSDERLVRVHERLGRNLLRRLRAATKQSKEPTP
jgi:hypothetical protein